MIFSFISQQFRRLDKQWFISLLLPLFILVGSLVISVVAVATDTDMRLRAYGVPLLPVQFQPQLAPAVRGAAISGGQVNKSQRNLATKVLNNSKATPSPLVSIAVKLTSAPTPVFTLTLTPKPTLTPTSTIFPFERSCRQDCTYEACPEGLVCMALASDEGVYTYQCLNPSCVPARQDEYCRCLTPTPSVTQLSQ